MDWTRRIVVCAIATMFFALLVPFVGKTVRLPDRCKIPSDAMAQLETLSSYDSAKALLGDPNEECGRTARHILRNQTLADYGLLIAYSALTAALFLRTATRIQAGSFAWGVKILGLLLATGMLVCDATENSLQLRLLGSAFRDPITVVWVLKLLDVVSPAKWWFLVASALVLAMLNILVYRGVGRVVLATLYLSAVVQGYESLHHRGRGFQSFLFVLGLAWLGSMLQALGAKRLNRWRDGLRDLALVVKPCRFSLIAAVLVVGALAFLPQGHDLLEHLAEWEKNPLQTQIILAFLGLFILGAACWYTARVALYIIFGDTPAQDTERLAFLRKWVPRWIGMIPFVGMFVANLMVLPFVPLDHHHAVQLHLLVAALLCLALGATLLFLVIKRRDVLNWYRRNEPGVSDPRAYPRHASFKELMQANPGTRNAIWIIAVLSVALFVTLAFPSISVYVAPILGSIAVVFFAVAMWLPFGSYLAYLGHRHRFPLLTLLLVLVPLFSLINDNHKARTLDNMPRQASMEKELMLWAQVLDRQEPQESRHPLVIVATEGGGVRAAYWTTSVLAAIQDNEPSFARHIFAISSVSGGSLGAGVFSALVADANRGIRGTGTWSERAQDILGQDLLSSDLSALLSGDFLQRFLPFPVPAWDRSRALEASWERAYRTRAQQTTLSLPFTALWSDKSPDWVPRLILNCTWVETGKRAIITPLISRSSCTGCPPLFTDSAVLLDGKQKDLPLSSALHDSARFPYVSPPGRLDGIGAQGGHVVDGGLFDNSGAATALEIIARLQKDMAGNDQLQKKIGPILVVGIVSNPEEEEDTPPPANFMADALASPEALWNARDARASLAVASLRGLARELPDGPGTAVTSISGPAPVPAPTNSSGDQGNFFQFRLLTKDGTKRLLIPLGWQLSELARQNMSDQLKQGGTARELLRLTKKLLASSR
jgi:hypothetical protein